MHPEEEHRRAWRKRSAKSRTGSPFAASVGVVVFTQRRGSLVVFRLSFHSFFRESMSFVV